MNKRAAEFVDEHSEATKDALSLLALGMIGWFSNLIAGVVEENVLWANLANLVTILSFGGAIVRSGFIFQDWKERRKMIAIKKKIREEELAAVEREKARGDRLQKNMQDLLDASTGDEIAEILRRNSLEKRDE